MQRKKIRKISTLLLTICALALIATQAEAATILVSDEESSEAQPVSLGTSSVPDRSAFTVTNSAQMNSVILYRLSYILIRSPDATISGSNLTVSIYTGTPANPGTLLGSTTGNSADTINDSASTVSFSFGSSISLTSGDSYVVEVYNTASEGGFDWGMTSSVDNTGTDGSVDSAFYFGPMPSLITTGAGFFEVDGTVSSVVPEPAAYVSATMLGVCMIGRCLYLRRRRLTFHKALIA